MSSWSDGSQTTPLAKLPFRPPAAAVMWRNNSPFCPGICLSWEMTNYGLLNISCLIFDIFPRDPTLPSLRNRMEIKMLLFFFSFRDGWHCFWRVRQIYKHLQEENRGEAIKAPGDVSVSLWPHGIHIHLLIDSPSDICSVWKLPLKWSHLYEHFLINLYAFVWTVIDRGWH